MWLPDGLRVICADVSTVLLTGNFCYRPLLVSHTVVVALPGSFGAHDGVFVHVYACGTSPNEHRTLMLYTLTCAEH